ALIYGAAVEECVAGALDAVPGLRVWVRIGEGQSMLANAISYETAIAAAAGTLDDIEPSDDDLLMLFTGGTTGKPKGVLWPHKDFFFAALGGGGALHPAGPIDTPEQLADRMQGGFRLRILSCGPLMHGNGLQCTTIGLLAGCTVCLNDRP